MSDQIDTHIGTQLRRLRELRGMSLSALGREIGTSYQQVRKYESGENRISASTLYRLSALLDVGVAYFFQGLPHAAPAPSATDGAAAVTPSDAELKVALDRVNDREVRHHLEGLLQALSGGR